MTHSWTVHQVDEAGLGRLAERIALKLRAGDTLSLSGGLGAGKTTFARALIRALLDDAALEVPSPTFSLVQTYDSDRLAIAHLDLYRLGHEDETRELGLDDVHGKGALVIEWGERAPSLLGPDRLEIELSEGASPTERTVALRGHGSWSPRLTRVEALSHFLGGEPSWRQTSLRYLQGDASVRAYARVLGGPHPALLMDWPRQPDGPPIRAGLPYSRLAHLAEDVTAFVAVDGLLREGGFRAPEIYAADLANGFLILEDLGPRVFGREVAEGGDMEALWQAAVDVLVALRRLEVDGRRPLPVEGGDGHALPPYDANALAVETELLLDWYWPMTKGHAAPPSAREDFAAVWAPLFAGVLADAPGLVLRDFHSPNLIWTPDAGDAGTDRVGLIDFQDAVLGHPAYDLVSLLQDARLDVGAEIEHKLLQHYCDAVAAREPGFDPAAFRRAYAVLGTQRNTKILGIFARLAKRDGKQQYLTHIPRIWGYLERDLAHPVLSGLSAWYAAHFPREARATASRMAS